MKVCKLCYVLMILLGLSVILSLPIQAFQLKYYGSHWEDTITLDGMQGIPSKYFEGIRAICVYERNHPTALGHYYLGGKINLYTNDWDKETLIHELAHHCQMQRKDTWYNAMNHLGKFNECYEEIINASY